MKYRIYLAVAGAAVVAAILFRPRSEPAARNPEPATPPAGHPGAGLAARRMAAFSAQPEAPPENARATNLLDRLINGDGAKLTPEQIGAFLAANHRCAESLLAASRASDDPAYLKEAKERFPDNPGQTVQDYMDQITQHKAAIRQFAQQNEKLLPNMPPEDLISFLDREKLYGEPAALQWYLNKSGQTSGTGPN